MAEPLKLYFDRELVDWWREALTAAAPIDGGRFTALATKGLESLEMMDRVRLIAAAMRAVLPPGPKDLDVLHKALPDAEVSTESPMDGYRLWPLSEYLVACEPERFRTHTALYVALTTRFTAEFAVRPFVDAYPEEAIERFSEFAASENPHLRRLASEGLRPRLPWGKRLSAYEKDPRGVISVLDRLHDDASLYVRRSVANTLGDIAKAHPVLAIETVTRWQQAPLQKHNTRTSSQRIRAKAAKVTADASDEEILQRREWVSRHALRHLVKQGHAGALAALGYAPPDGIVATLKLRSATIKRGETLQFSLVLHNPRTSGARLLIDYRVRYPSANGELTRSAVFKGCETELDAGDTFEFATKRRMVSAKTRPIFEGTHELIVQVNGVPVAAAHFKVSAATTD